ncbi:hypothetical protein BDV93DRAFT_546052 [Ceratobasidium sp. AG-I]|nr:hypothetical protein BDV93DRAFT_546052 [Ceratobasidium sp. AG-I]
MPADNEKLTADEVTALSVALRLRSANLKKQAPADQYEAQLRSGQEQLIPEPHGEPGRNPKTLNKATNQPKGYQLQTVLGLAKFQATHNHYMKTIEDNAVGMIWGKTYSKQRRNSIALSVAKALKEFPIFHCYEDHWPIHAYLKGILKSKKDSKRITQNKMAREEAEEEEDGAASPDSPVDPLDAHDPEQINQPTENELPAPQVPASHTEDQTDAGAADGLLDFDLGPPAPPSEDDLTPPPAVIPAKRRGRGNPDRNLPGKRNPRAQELRGTTATTGSLSSQVVASTGTRTTRSRFAASTSSNAEAGPGPLTMANQKALARRKAKNKA